MSLKRLATLCLMLGPLAACQTVTPQEQRAADERTCLGYGFRPNTQAMARCLLDVNLDRRAQDRALRYEARRALWEPMLYDR